MLRQGLSYRRAVHFRSVGLLWAYYPRHNTEQPFRDRRPCYFICSTGHFHGLVTAVGVDVRTRGGLLVGVTWDARDDDGMVPRWNTPRRRVLSTAGGRHIMACVLWIPELGSQCLGQSSIITTR